MNPERWKRIDEIFHAALERAPSARADYLAKVCKDDDSLRSEVEELIASHEREISLFENPAVIAGELIARQPEPYQGTVSLYKILQKIGSGGMGEVYLAQDSRLNRLVALKILPLEFTKDKDRVRRFEREARAISALNHPYILTIYDIGQTESSSFIASEYIDGETLRHRMQKTKIPLKQILEIATQVAEALDSAHRAGIIHRDIKPENIMLRKDGYVKVLDFGLAKLTETELDSKVETISKTQPGVVLGTVRYMSPEQARALKVDERTDIFSLGVVLYEMITGRVPFDGATSSDVLAAILEKNPLALRTYGDFPDELQWIVTKALAKDPEERYQMAKDLLTDLKRVRKQIEIAEELKRSDASLTIKTSVNSKTERYLKFFALAVIVLIAGVVAIEMARRRPPPQVIERRLIQKQITFSGSAYNVEISPDGKFLAYCEPKGVFVQSLSGGNPLPVSNNEIVYKIRWSPDGSQLLIVTADKELRGITVSPFGGQPRPISPIGTIVSWSPDSKRVAYTYVSRKYIEITSLRENKKVSTINIRLPIQFIWIDDLHWSAAGRFALLVRTDSQVLIATLKDDGSQPVIVLNETSNTIGRRLRWSSDGKSIFYWKEGKDGQSDLMKIEISPETGKAVANPKLILSDPASVSGLSFSNNGILTFARNLYRSNIWSFHVDDSNQKWTKNPLTQGTWVASFPSISPDGKTVAFDLAKRGERSIFSVSSSGGEIHQLTYDNLCYRPAWSPSGKTIAAVCDYGGVLNVVLISPDGSMLKRFDSTKVSQTRFVTWASDNSILYQLPGNRNFNFLNTDSGKENPLLTDTSRGWMFDPIVSPDQKKAIFEVNWQAKNLIGIWLENLSNHTGSILVSRPPMEGTTPIAWSADSEWVYFWRRSNDNPEDIISKIHVDTKKEFPLPRFDIGEDQSIEWISIAQDEKTYFVSVGEYESDAWIVENFDPK